jgi:peroxiredoxin
MKQAAWALGLAVLTAASASAQEKIKIGDEAKAFKVKDAMKEEETWIDLAEHKGKNPIVLVWISEKCDITWRYEGRTGELLKEFGPKGVKFFAVWSSQADTAQSIRKYAESKNYVMPVLDDAKGEMARHFGVAVTPTYVVVDKDGKFRYRGAYDDLQTSGAGFSQDASKAKDRYVHAALTSLFEGKEIAVTEKKGVG